MVVFGNKAVKISDKTLWNKSIQIPKKYQQATSLDGAQRIWDNQSRQIFDFVSLHRGYIICTPISFLISGQISPVISPRASQLLAKWARQGSGRKPLVFAGPGMALRKPSSKERSAGNWRNPGCLFFGYFLLATQKKVSRSSVREPTLKWASRSVTLLKHLSLNSTL